MVGIMEDNRIVLCGANAYEKKYYFNEKFSAIPESIKEELHIICEDGTLSLETDAAEEDYLYDEIGSGLLIKEIQRNRQELFESLALFYKVVILHEDVAGLLES